MSSPLHPKVSRLFLCFRLQKTSILFRLFTGHLYDRRVVDIFLVRLCEDFHFYRFDGVANDIGPEINDSFQFVGLTEDPALSEKIYQKHSSAMGRVELSTQYDPHNNRFQSPAQYFSHLLNCFMSPGGRELTCSPYKTNEMLYFDFSNYFIEAV